MFMLHATIMAGGAGTRFWPASRANKPKQLLDFGMPQTLLQAAVNRLGDLVPPERVQVITNRRLVAPTRALLPGLTADRVVGEPCKRDTAPCVGLAAALVMNHDPEAIMLVTPADHIIGTAEQFQTSVRRAVSLVHDDAERIVIFGIKPSYPAATFGYIERGTEPLDAIAPTAYGVQRFREKPSAQVAKQYLAAGNYYWNAGIFVWKAITIWNALARFEPEMHARLQAIQRSIGTSSFDATLEAEFAAIKRQSIDFAVMERYEKVVVVEAPFAWDDLGNWPALARSRGSDGDANTIVGKHVGVRTGNCIVNSSGDHLVATLGVHDLIIVHTPDATLVANRFDEESVRELVKRLEELGWHDYL
jgi:mannose-1-phosphate guanylyltransferase